MNMNTLHRVERAFLATAVFTLGAGALVGCANESHVSTKPSISATSPRALKTFSFAVGGIDPYIGSPNRYSSEEVEYDSNGERSITFLEAPTDGVSQPLDTIGEGCYNDPEADAPGHDLLITDGDLHTGVAEVGDSPFCADERLTPSEFTLDPAAIG